MVGGRHVHATPSRGSSPWLSAARNAGRVVAAAVSLLLVVGFYYGWRNYRNLDQNLKRISVQGLGQPTPSGSSAAPHVHGVAQNLLIAGNDDRTDMTDKEVRDLHTGRDGGSINTDTMMIVHIPADGSKATLISLPRDSYVDIPGFRKSKLNAAYPDGYYNNVPSGASIDERRAAGASLLVRTVHQLTGLTIDHFLQVDLIGFYRISEAIGPVDVNMCEPINDPNSALHLHKGINPLVGRSALAFVRARETIPGGDLARVQHQRYFLTAAFRKIASAHFLTSPSKLSSLIAAVDNSIYVDNNGFSIQQLAEQLINLTANNITGVTIPLSGEGAVSGVGDVLFVNPARVQARVQQLLSPVPHSTTSHPSTHPPTSPSGSSSTSSNGSSGCIH